MSELQFKSAKRPLGRSVRWEEEGDDSKSVYLGDVVQGEYMDKQTDVGPNNSNVYSIKLDDGSHVDVWGTTLLDSCFEEGNDGDEIPLGAIIRITCLGKKQGKTGPSKQAGKGYWQFNVEFAIPSPAFKSTAKPQSSGAQLAQSGQEVKSDTSEDSEDGY